LHPAPLPSSVKGGAAASNRTFWYCKASKPERARPTWSAMCAAFSDQQLLDIIFTIGTYFIMATILKTAQVPDEDDH